MAEHSAITWTHATFNPWMGCSKVSPGCAHCYAEAWSKRFGGIELWGEDAPRQRTHDWRGPFRWNAKVKDGERRLVFCGSLCDVFEDRPELQPWREDLWELVAATPRLTWLFLTKRIENVGAMFPELWEMDSPPQNVWIGATAEDQERADERLPIVSQLPTPIRFVSVEPMLGRVNLHLEKHLVNWVIVGGESGKDCRPMELGWARDARDQCRDFGVAFFMKQDSGFFPGLQGRIPDDLWIKEFPLLEPA